MSPGQPDAAKQPRVMLVGAGHAVDSMEWHVADALAHLGCEFRSFDARGFSVALPQSLQRIARKAASILLREPERLTESRFLREVADFAPDLVLVILGNQLSPKTVARLRRITKAPVVCWCQDQMTTLGRQFLLGCGYDAVFLKDRYLQQLFSRMIRGTGFHYLAEACNPRVHRPVELTASDRDRFGCDLMIAGTLYYYRQGILKQLREFDLRIWGEVPDWLALELPDRHMGRPVYTADKARAVAAASISLNTLHYAEVDGLNCRAFELAGCGALQLITAVPVLADHFVPDEEIVTFADIDELIDKARYYIAHPEIRAAIAQRAWQRAHCEHTYELRLAEIFRTVL